jgi:hypothetical protein
MPIIGFTFSLIEPVIRYSNGCRRPTPVPDLIGDDRAIQYAAAFPISIVASGILGRPVKPGDDE